LFKAIISAVIDYIFTKKLLHHGQWSDHPGWFNCSQYRQRKIWI